ncbi:MAG: BamA/TamA family outer membrane protein [Acidobacteria bacterium]|nr:BamA/TamA family outer membrane protein [Acidobacteriota bacterium]
MFRRASAAGVLALALAVCASTSLLGVQEPDKKPSSDLDAFMQKALARRDVNRRVLNDYILDEGESFEILGPSRMRLHRTKRDYTWYVRDGMHVRSPVRFDGVGVGADARDRYEKEWIARERARQERKRKHTISPSEISTNVLPTEPRFVSEAYFMDFKFEPGNYFLAGREKLDGHDVLKIEYYPKRLFSDDDKKTPKEIKEESKDARRERKLEDDIERKMNKTALVTLWVDPTNHQIVKYTFDNVWLDFLPAAWLVRVDAMKASMTMSQPFAGVWLPRGIEISAGVSLASGGFEANYARSFSEYREADVKSRIKTGTATVSSSAFEGMGTVSPLELTESGGSGPFAGDGETVTVTVSSPAVQETVAVPVSEVVREVRVHGNAALPDAEVLKLAGVAVGAPLGAEGTAAIERRLKTSGRFETVEVRKRYRSIDDPSDVAIVLLVHEKITVVANPVTGAPMTKPSRWISSRLMFLPIVSYADGYGLTYGARVSTKDLLGAGERLSVPATWGGTRRIALEAERTFTRGPFTRLLSSAALSQRENPRYEIDDHRVDLRARGERNVAQVFFAGIETSRASIRFADLDDTMWTVSADAALDTRANPAFPSNAVYLGGGWTSLNVDRLERINRYTADARAYGRLVGQMVLAVRGLYTATDAPLPIYERLLIGGSSSLRGFDTGAFDGDKTLVASAELRVPITSVISGSRFGVTIFTDAAKAAEYGGTLKDATWHRGAGAGVFLIASIVRINVDVARGFDGGGTRAHLSSGFSF